MARSSAAKPVSPGPKVTAATPPPKVSPATPPKPSPAEQRAIDDAVLRLAERAPRVDVLLEHDGEGTVTVLGPNHSDHQGWLARLEDVFGTHGRAFATSQLHNLIVACQEKSGKIDQVKLNGMLAAIEGARPINEVQAMLAVQMAITHAAAVDILRRAQRVELISQTDSAGNLAVKLLRTYTMQVEALAKLQRGGEQIFKVVHVHSGGQAIVGNVVSGATGTSGEPRGGAPHETEHRPHAKGELPAPSAQPLPEVRRADAQREPVPVTSGAEQEAL
jgi:hypothetical protein